MRDTALPGRIGDLARRVDIDRDRPLAAFQCLEAIRLYAAEHNGQLPAGLADIKDVPVPVSPVTVPVPVRPVTGRPFIYRRTGSEQNGSCKCRGNVIMFS